MAWPMTSVYQQLVSTPAFWNWVLTAYTSFDSRSGSRSARRHLLKRAQSGGVVWKASPLWVRGAMPTT
jgi:hypothetical protein